MANGTIAKENIAKLLENALGQDFLGVYDKKLYVLMDDGDEKVQIAISMVKPKTPIAVATSLPASTELSPADKAKVEQLKKLLDKTF